MRKKLKLMVVATSKQAKEMQFLLGDEWKVVAAGDGLLGYHFEAAVCVNTWAWNPGVKNLLEWFNTSVKTRVSGPIIEL